MAAGSFWASASTCCAASAWLVKDIRLPGIRSAADQEVGQKGAGSGQRLLHVVPGSPMPPASGSSNSSERRYDCSASASRPSLRWMSPICW